MFRQARGVGEQQYAGLDAARVGREIAAQGLDIVQDDPGMIEQVFTGRGQLDAAAAALQQRDAERGFKTLDPRAGRRQRQIGANRAARDAARIGHRDEQPEVDQIESHGELPWRNELPWAQSEGPAFVNAEGRLRKLQIVPIRRIGQCDRMFEPLLFVIAATFLLAGFVKSVIGLGLPTVSMGLLAVTMQPSHALAIVIVPAVVTNIWQTFVGSYLRDITRRLWPLMVGTVIGIWLNGGLLTGPYAPYGTVVLGVLLVVHAIVGLSQFNFKVARRDEKWIGGIVGLATGVVSAATGVQVIPS